ncbi:hypothetical protein O181_024556 [Austropuccinia psidii MF-1]|uniref:Uncharacterized protein n=1 Tax=Austropuccinia psidii MF-1 TaxID=1389203 RepID=A0A9Q3GYQ9_9BASI|nr:hypothetical protein [Austropuccinia psidii MF-1]
MDITLALDIRYHKRKKKKSYHQENKHGASKSNSSHPQNSSSPNQKKEKNLHKRDKPHSSLLDRDFKLMGSEKQRRIKEGLCFYRGRKHILESHFKRPQTQLSQPSGKFPSHGKARVKIIFCSMVFTVFHPEHNCAF